MLYKIFLGQSFLEYVYEMHYSTNELYFSPVLYNCTGTEIYVDRHLVLGILYFTMGFLAQNFYLLVLKTFWFHEPFWEHESPTLIVCAEFAGIWSILGLHPCYNMKFAVFSGCLVFGTWHMSCFYVLILAFSKSCEQHTHTVFRCETQCLIDMLAQNTRPFPYSSTIQPSTFQF
ncbi:hypothetical protein CRE_21789 [Caenorhabditis remanei]|uniref:Uncharacterized protein n=1 Tax=Caenorhabditis remanei TaxID=31234 RepID=E3MEG7_CAERE|nr:hypothetical protein CRE_21789 [Caenorhabditis remanei]